MTISATKPGKKRGWPVVAARVPPELHRWLTETYKGKGDASKVILCLLQRLRDGKIYGVKIDAIS